MDLSIGSPDDLAAFALDALETSELKAVEARLDGQQPPPDLDAWRQALGEVATLAAEQPPSDLRDRALSSATARRPFGAALQQPEELPANEAYSRTVDALGRLLSELSPEDWSAPTIEGWTVKGLVAHLVAVEEYFGRQLGLWPLEIDEALEADHLGMTQSVRRRVVGSPGAGGAGPLAGADRSDHEPLEKPRPRGRSRADPLPLPRHLARRPS